MKNSICPVCGGSKIEHNKYCSYKCRNIIINKNKDYKKQAQKQKEIYENEFGKIKKFKVLCNNCKTYFFVYERESKFPIKEKYFCSRSCANTRNHSNETKEKISISIKNKWEDPNYAEKCINSLSNNRNFSSKGEREILRILKEKYINDEWTSGGLLKYKNERIQRDIFSKKLKVCIEYDGIWHFKNINGQLKRKQYKDNLLNEWCVINNYRILRVRDGRYIYDKENIFNLIIDFVYNSNERYKELY